MDNDGRGGDERSNKNDVYAIDATYTLPAGGRLGGFYVYRNSGNEKVTGDSGAGSEIRDQQHWIGVAGEGQHANLFGGFTAVYLTGELDAGSGGTFESGNSKLDREAYLINLEGTGKFGKGRVMLGWLYASGDDDNLDDKAENFDVIDVFTGHLGSAVVFHNFADDNTLVSSPYVLDKGLNLVYLQGDYDLTNKVSAGLGYLWHSTAEEIVKDDFLGHEIVARASYKIAKGLVFDIRGGYLIGGDAWDDLASDGNGDDVFRTDARLRYKF